MTAMVTGASSGLGRAIAIALAQAGHDVAVHYRGDRVGALETVEAMAATGRVGYALGRDLAIAEPAHLDAVVAELLDDVVDELGPLDVAVLNAFPQDLTPWPTLDSAAWDQLLDGGLRPTAALISALGERLRPGGVIVTVGSVEGLRPAPGHTAYAVSKAAVHHLTAAAAQALGPAGLRVVGVAPGLIERPGLREQWLEGVQRWERASPLGRMVTATEVAATVAFLASPAASAITGVTVPVDAGWSCAPGW